MQPALAIIADDLTGALDAAAPFAARGLHVVAALAPEDLPAALMRGADIVTVTTASRDMPPDEAAQAVAQVVRTLPPVPLFKKIDSRLKGNIAAELSALPFRHALMAPAIPEFGRIQQSGMVTGFGLDQPIAMRASLGALAGRVECPDIATPDEMTAALSGTDCDLLIGARGLADALARQMTGKEAAPVRQLPGPDALFVIGSRDPITMAQVAALREMTGTVHIAAPDGRASPPFGQARRMILQATATGDATNPGEVGANLARLARPLMAAHRGTVLMTGGETAQACLRACGAAVLTVRGECLPGLVVSDWDGVNIVTKSGGFGAPDCLIRVAGMIEGGDA